MPELPEAETIARALRRSLQGHRLVNTTVIHDDVVTPAPEVFRRRLEARRVEEVARRGKNVVLVLDGSTRLVVNLGMSGRLLFRTARDPSPPPSHPAVTWTVEGGGRLVYHDVRRFGRLDLLDPDAFREWSRSLGPEPLGASLTGRRLARALSQSRSPVRSWLLDQRRVAGIGNIYANEALHRAGIHPLTPANQVAEAEAHRLHRALRGVLREAIRAGGTTLRDYRSANGDSGRYALQLRVYGREGESCGACGTRVARVVLSGRSAFFCRACQPERGTAG